jgi:ribonuclease HI
MERDLFSAHEETQKADMLTANIDGGARGNPGPAGYGVLVRNATGEKVAELSEYLGHQTNNFAEYSGLLAALRYALEHGGALRVISDSELLVKQIKGQYKVKSPGLRELYDAAQDLISRLEYFRIEHALREKNRDADCLANEAMDRGMGRAIAAQSASPEGKELRGIVRDGVVEFLGEKFPEGVMVKIRRARE